jgi:AcrR family transcriptional regulator
LSAREQILGAADRLFGDKGFDAASVREIAEECGVNKALVHYHFGSKDGLFESVLDNYYQRLDRILLEAMQKPGSPRERISNMLDTYVDFLAQNRNFSRIVQRESSGGKHLERIREHLVPMFSQSLKLLHDAFPQTSSGDLAAEHLLVSFYGMIVAYFTWSEMLQGLTGSDPLSKTNLAARKKHLHKMLDTILQEMDRSGSSEETAQASKAGEI